jgi:hypothetical protein
MHVYNYLFLNNYEPVLYLHSLLLRRVKLLGSNTDIKNGVGEL